VFGGGTADTCCLITDVRMTGMSSVEMHERLRAEDLAPSTIFISAYTTPTLRAKVEGNCALVLLEKPYQVATMTLWLAVALGDP
jgi:FixJ family two-component response regulator